MKTKVICVSTGGVPELTLHKIYDGFIFQPSHPNNTNFPHGNIQVVNDKNRVTTYKGKRFMELDEFRQNRLNELGI